MRCDLVKLTFQQLPQVYHMMRLQDFPDTPDTLDDALTHFNEAQVLGLYHTGRLQVAFILLCFTEYAACLDVVCHPEAQGKWASRTSLRQLYQAVFEQLNLDYIWAEPKNHTAMKACFQAGFQMVPVQHQNTPVMVLTRRTLASLIKYERN